MRKISSSQILIFLVLLTFIFAIGIWTNQLLLGWIPLGDFRGVTLVVTSIVFIYLYAFLVYRLFLAFMPLKEGEISEGSREEFGAQVNNLFYLVLFNSIIRTHFLPVPLLRLIYLALGARLGESTFSAGVILDPPMTKVGNNTIIGHNAVLFSHAIEGRRFAFYCIRIGDNATIGANAVIMPGVTIGDGAIVSAGAVVIEGTCIGVREIWGGVPARLLKRQGPQDMRGEVEK